MSESKVNFKDGHVLYDGLTVGSYKETTRPNLTPSIFDPDVYDDRAGYDDWDDVPEVEFYETDFEINVFEHGMPHFFEIGKAAPDEAYIYGYHDGIAFLCSKSDIENAIPVYSGVIIAWDRATFKNITVEWPLDIGIARIENTRDGDILIVNSIAFIRKSGVFEKLDRKPTIIL